VGIEAMVATYKDDRRAKKSALYRGLVIMLCHILSNGPDVVLERLGGASAEIWIEADTLMTLAWEVLHIL
jgi:hypothetical protein